MNLRYIIILFFLTLFPVTAQQNPQFSDYKLNRSIFNPAFGGFFDGSVLLLNRSQFTGIEGAPQSVNLSINAPLTVNMGMALNVISEKLGVTDEVTMTADYSYTIYVGELNMLTFGLKAGFSNLNINYSLLDLEDTTDISFATNIENKILPRMGIGFLFNTPNLYIGLSTPNFINKNYDATVSGSTISRTPSFFFNMGYNMRLNNDLVLEPSVLVKFVENAPLAVDMALNFEYQEVMRFGASYRWNNAVTGLIGFEVLRDFQIGYAYDYNINALAKYAPSSHQFYLKYTFKRPRELMRQWQL
ncbi:PorP/SprF family type IX secretion system membrane protein [Flavobacterium algicola]|uniref:PorP/SprF family type IX secretion system membrane protein n=1 Tax=Flavobacterium algicola TaxID=556529 RepID=UPI001EFD8274|nr:type IX secretion system membrane protein PorP/SprF [Flavobacterium algicola]MCG9793672.1 type IX secretion system membrane protein PorP/SprF [Flavobacterium algicola]